MDKRHENILIMIWKHRCVEKQVYVRGFTWRKSYRWDHRLIEGVVSSGIVLKSGRLVQYE